jgi:hypothetical protein
MQIMTENHVPCCGELFYSGTEVFNSENYKYIKYGKECGGCEEKGIFVYCWYEMKIRTIIVKNYTEVYQKDKSRTNMLPNYTTSGDVSKGYEISMPKEYMYCHIYFHIICNG